MRTIDGMVRIAHPMYDISKSTRRQKLAAVEQQRLSLMR